MDTSNPKYIKINKPMPGQLFASGLYCYNDKLVLEIIAPRDIIRKHEEYDDSNLNIGERWVLNLTELEKSHWSLENSSYYIDINGIKIGEDAGSSTRFRYEPYHGQKEESQGVISENMTDGDFDRTDVLKPTENGLYTSDILKLTEDGLYIPDESEQKKCLKNIFEDQDFQNTLISLLESLPPVNLDNPDDNSNHEDYFKIKEKEEERFFSEFRSRTYIPDYLQDRSILLAECIFRGKNLLPLLNEVNSIKFVMKSTTKYLLTRVRFILPFGECLIQIKSDTWSEYTEKVWLEGIEESTENDGRIKNMPAGKKAVFIRYETVDNVSVQPVFYTTEALMSDTLNDNLIFNKTKRLEEKGEKGFYQYVTFAGFVDEDADKANFELFQLIVTFELNKEYVLL